MDDLLTPGAVGHPAVAPALDGSRRRPCFVVFLSLSHPRSGFASNGEGATRTDTNGAAPPRSCRVVFYVHIAAPRSGRGAALVPPRQTRYGHHAGTDAALPALSLAPRTSPPPGFLITGVPPPSWPAWARGRRGARASTASVRSPLAYTRGCSTRAAPRDATVASQAPAPCVGRDARVCWHALPPAPAVHRGARRPHLRHPAGVGRPSWTENNIVLAGEGVPLERPLQRPRMSACVGLVLVCVVCFFFAGLARTRLAAAQTNGRAGQR